MRMKYEKDPLLWTLVNCLKFVDPVQTDITFNHKVLVPILSTFEEQNAESILEPLAVLSLGPQD